MGHGNSKDSSWQGKAQHCLVTGGSQGLGKQVALQLVARGSHVTILARSRDKLEAAATELKGAAAAGARVAFVTADVTDGAAVAAAVETASRQMQHQTPSLVFCCAGAATPGLFLEQETSLLASGMATNYLGAAYTAHACAKAMVAQGVRDGRIVLVGSTLSLLGIAGYSQYAPAKAALRSLADCLRQELRPHGISVHLYCPGNIDTPGFAQEQLTKPEMTKRIEGAVALQPPEACASALLAKLARNHYMITSDFETDLLRCTMLGLSPRNNPVLDFFLAWIGFIAAYFVRSSQDKIVLETFKQQPKSDS